MTEQEQKEPGQRDAMRHARILEILLVAFLAIGGWTAVKVVDNSQQIAVIKNRLDHIEFRLDHIEERLTRIEAALNILVARKNGADEAAGAGDSKQSSLAPEQSKPGAKQGQLATR